MGSLHFYVLREKAVTGFVLDYFIKMFVQQTALKDRNVSPAEGRFVYKDSISPWGKRFLVPWVSSVVMQTHSMYKRPL